MLEHSYDEAPSYGSTLQILLLAYGLLERTEDAKRMARELMQIMPHYSVCYTLETTPFKDAPFLEVFRDALRAQACLRADFTLGAGGCPRTGGRPRGGRLSRSPPRRAAGSRQPGSG